MNAPQQKASTPNESITVRATISLPFRVKIWASEMCQEKGYDNFSAYIAELIRRDRGVTGQTREAA
jgi:hypothetical protein